ncbi:MAG: hypothetical protein HOP33_09240 [Verrucomicrobia bacterium]|nr:hypothetical protein [Verrucomicrobiota bacterium]
MQEKVRLESKLFSKTWVQLAWIIFLVVIIRTVAWPLRNIALVGWVYGWDAYSQDGLRVLPGKPTKFSNGELVPTFPDLVTGFTAFFATALGLTFLLIFGLRLYERSRKTNENRHS